MGVQESGRELRNDGQKQQVCCFPLLSVFPYIVFPYILIRYRHRTLSVSIVSPCSLCILIGYYIIVGC